MKNVLVDCCCCYCWLTCAVAHVADERAMKEVLAQSEFLLSQTRHIVIIPPLDLLVQALFDSVFFFTSWILIYKIQKYRSLVICSGKYMQFPICVQYKVATPFWIWAYTNLESIHSTQSLTTSKLRQNDKNVIRLLQFNFHIAGLIETVSVL